jgi:hypothetical protein
MIAPVYSVAAELDRGLRIVAIGALILYALCIWEFGVGIKSSTKRLWRQLKGGCDRGQAE